MEFLSQRPMFSDDESTKGFDLSSGTMWIYPENYPLREYQFQIVKSALYTNTLVCLPTGLGKTFVAAVVMYNFWRWYPQGKIVFLAPTKPLVAQQINACHDIMGIPSDETIELTGATDQKKRQVAWMKHRVIFATPQVFHKDLEKSIVPTDRVKCVVVDEAHKALGKHSYCESIRLLSEQTRYFRVLALSATPGGKLDAVQEVVRNLHITHMELRDDTSEDIIPYINERKLDIVLVGLGTELERFKDRYIVIMDRHVRVLVENNVLRGFAANISKGRIFHLQQEWQQKPNKGGNYGKIMKTLTILMTMYHAYELMVRHGLRAFYNFYQNHLDKFWLSDEKDLLSLLEEIIYYLGPFPDVRPLPDGSIPEIPEDIRFGHKKFQKLQDLLLQHFESYENKEEETRAIVFVEYRDIVNEVYVLLLQSRPLIRPQKFVGKAGQKQKQQKIALEDFRSNKVNVLISTSVGEEGLDVGEVDLIVCFDISQHSPIRLVQRMGRTGRKRDGHIIVLVTDGKEHQTLKSTMSRRDSLNTKVLQSSGIINALHEESPRMVPEEFNPECQKMMITVVPKVAPAKRKRKATEPKKPRKPAEANNRGKNPRLPESSTSNKPGSQSSLMQFFKKPTEEEPMEVDDGIVSIQMNEIPSRPAAAANRLTQNIQQSLKNNNTIKLSDVLLLSSDDAALEFLTLCTMKQSEKEQISIEETKSNPLLPSYYTNAKKYENFFDFEVPDLRILDCLSNITGCLAPSTEDKTEDVPTHELSDDCDNFQTPEQTNSPEVSKFEAILDEFSNDSDAAVFQPKEATTVDFPDDENVDWAANDVGPGFEDVLDDWSDESRDSNGVNETEGNKANEISCQAPADVLNEPGMFEDILDFSSDEGETNCRPKNLTGKPKATEETATVKKSAEIPIDDELKGAFDDVFFSSDESDTDCRSKNINIQSKATEETATTIKAEKIPMGDEYNGAFEDILISSSDENETDLSTKNINIQSKATEETATTIKAEKIPIVDEYNGAFEDILISSSDENETDLSTKNINIQSRATEETATTIKAEEITIDNEFKGAFEDILISSSDESETRHNLQNINSGPKASGETATTTPTETTTGDEFKGAFEYILISSSDESETRHNLQNINAGPKASEETAATTNPAETPIGDEFEGAFADVLNDFSDDSETDCSLENVNVGKKVLEDKRTDTKKIASDNEGNILEDNLIFSDAENETDCSLQLKSDVCVPKKMSEAKKEPSESSSNSRSNNSRRDSIRISTPLMPFESDESVDLLVDYEMKAVSQLPAVIHDQRHFTTFSKTREPSASGLSRNAANSVNFQSPASDHKSIPTIPKKIDRDKGAFEDLNSSDDGSETDCSLQPDVRVSKQISHSKHSGENRSSNFLEPSKQIFTQMDVEIDESVDLLADYEIKATPRLSAAEQRNFNVSKSPQPSTSRFSKNPVNSVDFKPEALKEKSTTMNPDGRGTFEDYLNFSDDESETDCSFQAEPDVCITNKDEIKKSTERIENRFGNSLETSGRVSTLGVKNSTELPPENRFGNSFQTSRRVSTSGIKNSTELPPENRFGNSFQTSRRVSTSGIKNSTDLSIGNRFGNSLQTSKRISTSGIKNSSTKIDEFVGTKNFDEKIWQSKTSTKIDEFVGTKNFDEKIWQSKASTSGLPNKLPEASLLTISQTMREIERLQTSENVYNESKVNKLTEGQEDNERSSSPIFPDRLSATPRPSTTSVYETARGSSLTRVAVDEIAESEEDIFGTEDLVVDSDFEAEIDNIEKSVAQKCNTDNKKSSESRKKWSDRSGNVSKVNSATTSFVSELNIDDLYSLRGKQSTVTESAADTVDLADFDWEIEEAKISTLPAAKESLAETADVNDCDWESEVKSSTPPGIKKPLNDLIVDDCDWGSDFEVFSSPLRTTTSFQKIFEKRESPGVSNLLKSVNNSAKSSKISETGWISTEKPKRCLSLGKKLSKNLSSLTKPSSYKPPQATKQDSDSENEFAVGRLETTLTKRIESDFFVKPDPVDKLTSDKSLGMSNSRRIIRGPLTLRRNDVNKLAINGLSHFSAPNKYSQQETRTNALPPRQKSASLDLDTRKRKKKQRHETRRARVRSEFIDDEAEVSSDDNYSSGSSGTDGELHDFVSHTQHHDEAVDMHAHYLQTTRSPHRARGFIMRKPKSPDPHVDIYSQAIPDEPNSYLYDSFCVAEDDNEVFEDSEPNEITLLEEREMRRKSRKRKRVQSGDKPAARKRRVIAPSRDSSSSEDDFEKLRRQIREESCRRRRLE